MDEHNSNPTELKPIEEAIADHVREKQDHVAALTSADEALEAAQREIEEGRRRLQNALDRYKERMHGIT